MDLDGRPVGELGWNAAIAASMGVPVVLATGDDALAAEAAELIPGIRTVAVKEARGRFAASCLHPTVAREQIRSAAAAAVADLRGGRGPGPRLAGPHRVRLELMSPQMAVNCAWIPTVEQVGWREISYVAADMTRAMLTLKVILSVANAARDPEY